MVDVITMCEKCLVIVPRRDVAVSHAAMQVLMTLLPVQCPCLARSLLDYLCVGSAKTDDTVSRDRPG